MKSSHTENQPVMVGQSRSRRLAKPIKRVVERFVTIVAKITHIDLLLLGYQNIGIMRYWNDDVSGETFARSKVLAYLGSVAHPVIFDVGANQGAFSESIMRESQSAQIVAFEPNPALIDNLKHKMEPRLTVVECAVGSAPGSVILYNYTDPSGKEMSAHGSIYPDVPSTVHNALDTSSVQVEMIALDDYVSARNMSDVHYIKIDTEGNELEVLRGASKTIGRDSFWFIQFEFNEMNVFSRSFLRDFYAILPNFDFFRLAENQLIPLGPYASTNEIFRYQNLLAVNRLKVKNFPAR